MLRIAAFRSLSRIAVVIVCKPLVRDLSHVLQPVLLWRTGAAQPQRLRNANGQDRAARSERTDFIAAERREWPPESALPTGIAFFARLHHDLSRAAWLNQRGPTAEICN